MKRPMHHGRPKPTYRASGFGFEGSWVPGLRLRDSDGSRVPGHRESVILMTRNSLGPRLTGSSATEPTASHTYRQSFLSTPRVQVLVDDGSRKFPLLHPERLRRVMIMRPELGRLNPDTTTHKVLELSTPQATPMRFQHEGPAEKRKPAADAGTSTTSRRLWATENTDLDLQITRLYGPYIPFILGSRVIVLHFWRKGHHFGARAIILVVQVSRRKPPFCSAAKFPQAGAGTSACKGQSGIGDLSFQRLMMIHTYTYTCIYVHTTLCLYINVHYYIPYYATIIFSFLRIRSYGLYIVSSSVPSGAFLKDFIAYI